ncbi:MAG: radical SAM protein [Candidatus Omnitrophota bacterium]
MQESKELTTYFRDFETNLAYYFSEKLNRLLAKPRWIYISLSHQCTYNCQMCGVVNILKDYQISTPEVKKIFDEISEWDWDFTVVITGGEPFLRRDIFEIFKYAKEKAIGIEVVSNGALIDPPMAEKIIRSGIDNIAVSLDGAKEGTHDLIREKGAFRKAVQAIKNLSEAKKKNGSGPQLSVWTTIMKENIGELFDIIGLSRSLSVECLVYHPVIVAQEDMQNTSPHARFWPGTKDVETLIEQIRMISDYQKKNGFIAFLHDPFLWVKHFRGELTRGEWKCNPFVFINIGPDGEVRSCGASFGNTKNMSLGECLDTKEASQARKMMRECLKPCLQTCWANPDADSLSGIVDSLIQRVRNSRVDKGDKKRILSAALAKLAFYEEMSKECQT